MTTGSTYRRGTGTAFRVWAPLKQTVELRIVSPGEKIFPMEMDESGYWAVTVAEAEPGWEYFYRLEGTTDRPDPASRLQQRGVHGPSTLVDLSLFEPDDPRYTPVPFPDHVIYELHVGAFTADGTLQAAAGRLDYLAELGVTAVELMPLAHFPGNRNWGYDGVYPYAVHTAYGGPAGLAGFVAEAHRRGIAVILDVVYNHLGPEGNYLSDFGPYLSAQYETPWGKALNFDGPYSDEVRRFFLENMRQWFEVFHIDGLRLDAVHAMLDTSANPILAEMSELAEGISLRTGKNRFLIAESLMNDSRVIRSRSEGGLGMTAEWLDDLHHALHARVTGERSGYYADFGDSEMVEASLSQAYALSRRYSRYWRRTFGNSALDCAPEQFVSYIQNHDQIGNRADGARIASLVSFEAQKMLAAVILLGPFVPMLFMGEEYGETAPFEYFVSHSDPDLVTAVREGRLTMFGDSHGGHAPADPQAPPTYAASCIRPEEADSQQQKALLKLYRQLISLRRDLRSRERDDPIPQGFRPGLHSAYSVERNDDIIAVSTRTRAGLIIILINLGEHDATAEFASGHLSFHCLLDTSAVDWAGPGQANPPYISGETAIRVRAQSVILLSQE